MLNALGSPECMLDCMMMKVDALYAPLNVRNKFPKLEGISLNFVQILLLACDLKINIKK